MRLTRTPSLLYDSISRILCHEDYVKRLYACCATLYRRVVRDNLFKESSALAYQSFMAIVPLLAVMFGIAKGFGLEQFLERWLSTELADHKEVLSYLLQFSTTALQQVQGGVIAGVGVLFLLFTIIRLLASIERVLNSMWGYTVEHTTLRRAADYMALVLVCPLLLAISSSATIFVSAQFMSIVESWAFLEIAHQYLCDIISFIPFVTSSILFAVILYALPKGSVRMSCALISGSIAAFFFEHVQSWYIIIQLHFTKVSAVYGSFVALPLFLVWVWISWFLLLLAGEVMVFLQEKGWKDPVLRFEKNAFSDFTTECLVYKASRDLYIGGTVLTFSTLYASVNRPIRDLTLATFRLEAKKFVLKCQAKGTLLPIIPAHEHAQPPLCDLVFPRIPENLLDEESSKCADTLRSWRKKLT
jgi:YihY family inner membrane protein